MARAKFEARDIKEGGGLLSDNHVVRQRNRRSAEYEYKGGVPRSGERLPEIKDAKRRVLNRLPQQDARVRRVMRAGIKRAFDSYKRADKTSRRKDGELRAPVRRRLTREANQIASESVTLMKEEVLKNMEGAVKTYLISVRRSLPDKSQLPMSVINDIARRKAIEIYQRPTGKDGVNTAQRLSALGVRVERELLRQIDKEVRDRSRASKVLVDPKGSHRSCVAKGFSRINRTEQNRAMQEATVEACVALGIVFFYWRLSAAHKSYGGKEVCEVLSESTGADVNGDLTSGFKGSLKGLYTANSLPDLPHPNCMCSIEPVI